MQGDRKKHSTFWCLPEKTPLACNVTLMTIPKSENVDFYYNHGLTAGFFVNIYNIIV